MTAKDYVIFVMRKKKGGLFCQACNLLGVPFKEAREKTAYFRADELIEVAFLGSPLTRKYFLRNIFPVIRTFNVLSASIVVAIMIIPTIASISEDSMRAVPRSLREAGYGLGVTKFQVTVTVVIPAALSGIVSSFILGISRAIGETMAVTIAGGNLSRIVNPLNPASALLEPIQTMTA